MRKKYHSHRLRHGRFSGHNQIYLITTVSHTRQYLFAEFTAGRLIVEQMRLLHQNQDIASLAFVVMPDHVHWLFQLKSASLSGVMKVFKGRSAQAINAHCHRQGPVWQPGFHDHGVRREADLLPLARYVIANPLRAGLVDDIGEYPLWDAVWL